MSLKDLRSNYLSGSISKPAYREGIRNVLSSIAEINELIDSTDVKSVKLLGHGGV